MPSQIKYSIQTLVSQFSILFQPTPLPQKLPVWKWCLVPWKLNFFRFPNKIDDIVNQYHHIHVVPTHEQKIF